MRWKTSLMVMVMATGATHAEPPRPQPQPQPDGAPALAPKAAPTPKAAPAPAPPAAAPKQQTGTLPLAALHDAMTQGVPLQAPGAAKALAMGGGFSAGRVITPSPHADQLPWPLGMVIRPPDTQDANAIVPGTLGLPPAPKPAPEGPPEWSQRFADVVHGGIGAIVELVLPSAI